MNQKINHLPIQNPTLVSTLEQPIFNSLSTPSHPEQSYRTNSLPLHTHVKSALSNYLHDLDGKFPRHLYRIVLAEVEKPLLETILAHTDNNQTRAADILGITRATLKKKLDYYNLI